ncbi:hypothetical protein FGIG_02622 [Fasciola gigantica]|uniref:Uncharacterized protein n=1 Tax=Fasciola gigantica TaxID=46835 RepID=A0A504Z0V1_FASGI|nr:hypothetical protein FGIG_02622 [Fasciola gigantica]
MSANEKNKLDQCVELFPHSVTPIRSGSRDECHKVNENGECSLSVKQIHEISRSELHKGKSLFYFLDSPEVKQSSLSADSTTSTNEPSSGFMLISVKRLSKVKRINRTRSASSLSPYSVNDRHAINKNNIDPSSRDDSSHTTSSPVCEEEGLDDFHGSGSIEAEEFEDDEVDESEGVNEDDSTTIVVSTAGKMPNKFADTQRSFNSLPGPHISNTNRPSQVHSSTQTLSRPDTPIGLREQCKMSAGLPLAQCRQSQKVLQTLPSGFSLSVCDQHPNLSQGAQKLCANNPLEVFRYDSLISDHGNVPVLPSFLTAHIQTNSSHYQSELDDDSCAPTSSVHTAPVSGHASPTNLLIPITTATTETLAVPGITSLCPSRPHPSAASMYYGPSSSLSLVAATAATVAANAPYGTVAGCVGVISSASTEPANWSNPSGVVRPSLVHSPYNLPLSNAQSHHAFSGLPLTCPLHPLSTGSSDVRSSQTISKTESDQLTADVVAISTASLPSLQPASRFRKARIHETVEQWCHGRLSIHDCHLKAVPDWVMDLQKKAPVLEQDISNALSQRVNCLSCLEQKALDRTGLQQSVGTTSHKGISDAYIHTAQSKVDENYLRRVLTRSPPRSNLFSFWDGGARVYCRLPKSSRLCIPPGVSEPSNLPPQPEDGDVLFIDRTLTGAGESREVCAGSVDGSTKVIPDSTSGLNEETRLVDASVPENVSPSPAIFLPPNNADPATAYLRRQQVTTGGQLSYLSAHQESLIKAGDSLSADELSLPLSDIAQSSPGSTEYTNQSLHRELPPFQVNRAMAHQYSSENSRVQEPQAFLVRKRPVLESIPVMVPPTSPTFMGSGAGLTCQSGVSDAKRTELASHTSVNGSGLTDVPPVQSKIQRTMNGEYASSIPLGNCGAGGYHNVLPHLAANGLTDPRPDSVKPSSLSSPTASFRSVIPYSHCSGATALLCEPILPVTNAINGDLGASTMSSSSLLTDQLTQHHKTLSNHPTCAPDSLPTVPPIKTNLNNGLDKDHTRNAKLSDLLSSRLETRINEGLDTIRMNIVSTVRDELLSAYSETAELLAEVDRLKDEVTQLRGYQAAFFALRPFVSVELWEHLNTQQARLQLLQSTPPLIPGNSGTSAPSVRKNSPQHVD